MQNTIYRLRSGNNTKSFMYSGSDIYFARDTQKDVEKFSADATYESGLLKSTRKISFFSIQKFAHVDEDATLKVWYEQNTKTKNVEFEFESEDVVKEIGRDIADLINFKQKRKQLSILRSVTTPLFFLGGIIFLTWNAYEDALKMEHGEHVHMAGHGKGKILSFLILYLAKELGTLGVLAVGGGLSLIAAYFLTKRFRNPPHETVYEKF